MNEISVCPEQTILKRTTMFLKRPLILIFIIGLIIRLVIAPLLTMGYDMYSWALTIENFQSDNGLYGLSRGYYYTPVWGYILGFTSLVQDFLLNIPVFGDRFLEAIPIESGGQTSALATITTIGFNVSVKIILFIADILVGYLIYRTIKEYRKDEKKATLGFALWFLCPIVIVVSSVGGMFDAFSVLFLISAVLLMYLSKYALAGSMFSLAVLTKFFPLFFLMFFVAHVLLKHREDGTAYKNLLLAVVGAAITALVIYVPLILTGTVAESLTFVTGRVSGDGGGSSALLGTIIGYSAMIAYAAILIVCALIAWIYYKKNDLSPENTIKFLLITATVTLLYPPTPQYVLLILPFLILYIIFIEKKLMTSWILLSIFVTASALTSNFTLLLSLGAYSDLISLDTVISLIEQYRSALVFGINLESIIYYAAGILQYISILSILYLLWKRNRNVGFEKHHGVNE